MKPIENVIERYNQKYDDLQLAIKEMESMEQEIFDELSKLNNEEEIFEALNKIQTSGLKFKIIDMLMKAKLIDSES